MDTSKLIASINAFTKYFFSNSATLKLLLTQLEKSINSVNEQLLTLSTISEAQLPLSLIEKHSSLRQRVMNCVSNLIDDEMNEIKRLLHHLEEMTNNLNKMFEKMEQNVSKLNWGNISTFHMTAFVEIINWSEKCSKYFRLIFCNINSALTVFHSDYTLSNKRSIKLCDLVTENSNLIFNHPAVEMFKLFEKEIFSS